MIDTDELRAHVIAGLNCPPSQFQLHLQYLVPPLLPFHIGLFKKGQHFTPGRFFPLGFLKAALGALAAGHGGVGGAAAMATSDLIARVKALTGIDYDEMMVSELESYEKSHALCANFSVEDFEYALPLHVDDGVAEAEDAGSSGGVVRKRGTTLALPLLNGSKEGGASSSTKADLPVAAAADAPPLPPPPNRKEVEDRDKLVLQSYGRPYDARGQPTGAFYSFPRQAPLPVLASEVEAGSSPDQACCHAS